MTAKPLWDEELAGNELCQHSILRTSLWAPTIVAEGFSLGSSEADLGLLLLPFRSPLSFTRI